RRASARAGASLGSPIDATARPAAAREAIPPPALPPPPRGPPPAGAPAPVSSPPSQVDGPDPLPGAHDPPPGPPAPIPAPGSSPLALSVATNHPTYRVGHRVRMTMTLKDIGKGPASLTPGPYGDGFTVLEGSTPVWHSAGVVSGVGSRRLKPGHSLTLRAIWDGRPDRAGVTIAPGVYTIEAVEGGYSGSSTIRIIA